MLLTPRSGMLVPMDVFAIFFWFFRRQKISFLIIAFEMFTFRSKPLESLPNFLQLPEIVTDVLQARYVFASIRVLSFWLNWMMDAAYYASFFFLAFYFRVPVWFIDAHDNVCNFGEKSIKCVKHYLKFYVILPSGPEIGMDGWLTLLRPSALV